MSNSLAIMRRDHTFPLVGQVMLCLFMLNALMGLRIIGPASHTSQGSLSSWVTSDNFDTAVSSGTGIIERFAAQRLLLPIPCSKTGKLKSALPGKQWEYSTPIPLVSLHRRAEFPLPALTVTSCYAIHARPPSYLTA